jgi:serine/threonine-protein kinase
MGTVFKAQDLEDGGRLVAVKVPLPEYSSGVGSWSISQREVEIGLKLRHPGIVRFVPCSPKWHQNLVVNEYLAGMTLAERIENGGPLGEAEALRIASKLCDAVAYLHAEGIVHYDLKPGNVMFCEDGSLRVIDFGVAHPVVSGRGLFSGQSFPIATAGYAAPEQIRRRRGQRSVDIYAIGAILYEMLTGHPPFEGDDPSAIASARQLGDPMAPRALNPAISIEAEEIVLRALRRDPSERYPSASVFKVALDRPADVRVSGLASRLIEVTVYRKIRRWVSYVGVVGVAPLASLVGLFALLWWYLERRH